MFLSRANNQYAILSSMVYTPSCQVTISLSGSLFSLRTGNVVGKVKGSMNSKGAALAALTAASALLAYLVFRKREPKKEAEEEVEQERTKEKMEPLKEARNNEGPEKGMEEECLLTGEVRGEKESLMEWIDRQLEEAERKTAGSPWPEIPQEGGLMIAGGEASHDEGAADPAKSFDIQKEGRELLDVQGDLKEAESQLLGTVLELEDADMGVPGQGEKFVQSGDGRGDAAGTLLAANPKHSLEGSLNPEPKKSSPIVEKEEKSVNDSSSETRSPSCTIVIDQFVMSSDSEIELLEEPSMAGDDDETGQLLDDTESEGENPEDVIQHVDDLNNEASDPVKMGSDSVVDNTPDELIALRPAWQRTNKN